MHLTRRDFSKLTAMGIAAELIPASSALSQAQSAGKKVGYAIIGLGRIADLHMQGIHASPNSKITALVSGHREKAEKYAAQYGIPASSIYSYETMDKLRDNPAVDATYVCLPNSMHAEYTIRSAKAGKHVFCEKPMSTSVTDAEAMIAACKSANVKLMMGYRCHYETTNLAAIKLIRDGALGKVRSIQSAFGFNAGANEWRLNMPLAGGGPLMDVGIYCLNATRYLTGEEPAAFSAYSNNDPQDPRFNHPNSVEEDLVWTTKFPSGIVASCSTSYGAQMQGYYRVYGSKGWLQVTEAFSYEGLHMTGQYWRDTEKEADRFVQLDQPNLEKIPQQFVNEADHFSRCILTGQTPQSPGEEGLRDMQYIQQIYKSAGITMA
jgi:predicted dehydrogenase